MSEKGKMIKNKYLQQGTRGVEFGKIGSIIMYLVYSITKLLEKQTRRVKTHTLIRKIRAQTNKNTNTKIDTEENMSKKLIIAMDCYWTRP